MKKLFKIQLLLVLSYQLLVASPFNLVPHLVQAAHIVVSPSGNEMFYCDNSADIDDYGLKCLDGVVANALRVSVTLIGIGTFLFLIYGGFRYVVSGGDQKAIDSAKKTLTYALFGLGGAVASLFIVSTFLTALGLGNLLQFRMPCNTAAQNWVAAQGRPNICP